MKVHLLWFLCPQRQVKDNFKLWLFLVWVLILLSSGCGLILFSTAVFFLLKNFLVIEGHIFLLQKIIWNFSWLYDTEITHYSQGEPHYIFIGNKGSPKLWFFLICFQFIPLLNEHCCWNVSNNQISFFLLTFFSVKK